VVGSCKTLLVQYELIAASVESYPCNELLARAVFIGSQAQSCGSGAGYRKSGLLIVPNRMKQDTASGQQE
jgi:hypothetical protein